MRRTPPVGFTCQVCSSTRARIVRREGRWSVARCSDCRLLATWPVPTDDELDRVYEDAEYYRERGMMSGEAEAWRERAVQVTDLIPTDPGAILDFGAGTGGLVDALRALGWEADGVEPSTPGRAFAREQNRVELAPSLDALGDQVYSAVVMLHVLEHLRDPVAELEAIRERLETAGTLVIEVPHAGAVDRFVPSRRHEILDLPAHMHHFTPRTLKGTLARAGYEVSDVRLFNSGLVERALNRRARARTSGEGPQSEVPSPPMPDTPVAQQTARSPRATLRRAWSASLATSRVVLPGPKFQVVAHPGTRP